MGRLGTGGSKPLLAALVNAWRVSARTLIRRRLVGQVSNRVKACWQLNRRRSPETSSLASQTRQRRWLTGLRTCFSRIPPDSFLTLPAFITEAASHLAQAIASILGTIAFGTPRDCTHQELQVGGPVTGSRDHLGRRLSFGRRLGWRDATQVGYFGLGTQSKPDDRANFRFKETFADGHACFGRSRGQL